MSATLGIGGGLGLPLSALVVEVADWHALFWVAGALGVAGIVVILAVIPESPQRSGGRFDAVGAAGLTVGLVLALLAISKGGQWGWGSATTIGAAVGAVVVLLVWGAWELRTTDPVVDLRISARRAVLVPNLVSVPVGVAMFTGMVTFPQLLQAPTSSGYGLGLSLLAAGLVLAPNGVVMMLMSPVTARVSARYGPRTSLQAGLVIIVVAYGLGTMLLSQAWHVALVISLVGAGVALAYGALPDLIMRAVPTDRTAAANGLNTLMRSVGTSTASAVAAVVLSVMTIRVGDAVLPSLDGLRTTLLIAAGAGLVALVATAAIPVLPRSRSVDETVVDTGTDDPEPVPDDGAAGGPRPRPDGPRRARPRGPRDPRRPARATARGGARGPRRDVPRPRRRPGHGAGHRERTRRGADRRARLAGPAGRAAGPRPGPLSRGAPGRASSTGRAERREVSRQCPRVTPCSSPAGASTTRCPGRR